MLQYNHLLCSVPKREVIPLSKVTRGTGKLTEKPFEHKAGSVKFYYVGMMLFKHQLAGGLFEATNPIRCRKDLHI